jgi:hypothetical protein
MIDETYSTVDDEPEADQAALHKHVVLINELAMPLARKGKLVIASFGEAPSGDGPRQRLRPKIEHFEIGDVDGMVEAIMEFDADRHRNIYMPLVVFRHDLCDGSKGGEHDIIGVLGLVADFDDADAARWKERLPVHPNYVLQTSSGRFQAFYLFDQPETAQDAKPIAERLKAFARCDHGTADLSHVWRIPGCLNWPNVKKVDAGRPRQPQRVRIIRPETGVTALADLAAALPPGPISKNSHDDNAEDADTDDQSAEPRDKLIEALVSLLPPPLRRRITETPEADADRSRDLFYVISQLVTVGLDDGVIESIIRHQPHGIGAKYLDRDDLDREIGRIRAKARATNTEGLCRAGEQPALYALAIDDFLGLDRPPREMVLEPWLPQKGLALVYSHGVGKTLLGLTVGYAAACGGAFLGFNAPKPRSVLYIDGEMPVETMQGRLEAIRVGFASEIRNPALFRILSGDFTARGLPDLATLDGQAEIDAVIGDAELIIIDNISTLVRSGKENEGESWLPVQGWALGHRRAGRSVLFIHHAGKGGLQRGTSRREDILDTVINLKRPTDYRADQGARFVLSFEKARGFFGDNAQSFEARYEERAGAGLWTRTTATDAELTRVIEALRDGLSIREAAEELGLHKSKVERLKKKAIEKGLLHDG